MSQPTYRLPEAAEEWRAAIQRYERHGLGDEFRSQVQHALEGSFRQHTSLGLHSCLNSRAALSSPIFT